MGSYDDIINLPHPVSQKHPHMSMEDRAAQFAPFAALVGFDSQIQETARLTDDRIILDEGKVAMLNEQIGKLSERLEKKPVSVTVTWFVPDERKTGGSYKTETKEVKKVDLLKKKLVFDDQTAIDLKEITELLLEKE